MGKEQAPWRLISGAGRKGPLCFPVDTDCRRLVLEPSERPPARLTMDGRIGI
jgi:hypothetical protein